MTSKIVLCELRPLPPLDYFATINALRWIADEDDQVEHKTIVEIADS